jgi:hypothetical protein
VKIPLPNQIIRRATILAAGWACCSIAIKADDTAKLIDLGTYFVDTKGELIVELTGGHAVWQNGRPVISQPYPDCGMMYEAFLKPGDSVIVGGPDGFTRYRLDRLSSTEASFTICHYVSVPVEAHRYRLGKMLSVEVARVDLPLTITDDSQHNLVQLGHGAAVRTK